MYSSNGSSSKDAAAAAAAAVTAIIPNGDHTLEPNPLDPETRPSPTREQDEFPLQSLSAKVLVTFFARSKPDSLLNTTTNNNSTPSFSPTLESDFTNHLASYLPPPTIHPIFKSLAPHVRQATLSLITRAQYLDLTRQPFSSSLSFTKTFLSPTPQTHHNEQQPPHQLPSYPLDLLLDIFLSPSPTFTLTVTHRPIRLVVFDMDSTLINEETIDELARFATIPSTAISSITTRAMNGEIDFEESLRARVALLHGLDVTNIWTQLQQESITIAPGARDLCAELKRRGITTAVASGGFMPMAEWLKAELNLDYAFANHVRLYFSHPPSPLPSLFFPSPLSVFPSLIPWPNSSKHPLQPLNILTPI